MKQKTAERLLRMLGSNCEAVSLVADDVEAFADIFDEDLSQAENLRLKVLQYKLETVHSEMMLLAMEVVHEEE